MTTAVIYTLDKYYVRSMIQRFFQFELVLFTVFCICTCPLPPPTPFLFAAFSGNRRNLSCRTAVKVLTLLGLHRALYDLATFRFYRAVVDVLWIEVVVYRNHAASNKIFAVSGIYLSLSMDCYSLGVGILVSTDLISRF